VAGHTKCTLTVLCFFLTRNGMCSSFALSRRKTNIVQIHTKSAAADPGKNKQKKRKRKTTNKLTRNKHTKGQLQPEETTTELQIRRSPKTLKFGSSSKHSSSSSRPAQKATRKASKTPGTNGGALLHCKGYKEAGYGQRNPWNRA
jgi:exopolysaccharide biosynthesis protein